MESINASLQEVVKADVRHRMGQPLRLSVVEYPQELGFHVITLYKWLKAWRLQEEIVPASRKNPGSRGLAYIQVYGGAGDIGFDAT